ncbi:MAG: response regulator transcription factor [Deltaproteobacteria bacterium]|nr:response regulator transcription factor [Deltaproteobacteria bacterium]
MNLDEQTIRILIVDDHAVVREGFEAVIGMQADMAVVGSIATGEAACDAYAALQPTVVLLDLRLPGMDGIETLRALRAKFTGVRAIMITSQEGEEAIFRAMKTGAMGYVFKKSPSSEILAAIRAAAKGEVSMTPEAAMRLSDRDQHEALSDREIEVLSRVGRGLSNKEIADVLSISPNTVKNHVNNIMTKLQAGDRTHAVTIAVQRGIITLDR